MRLTDNSSLHLGSSNHSLYYNSTNLTDQEEYDYASYYTTADRAHYYLSQPYYIVAIVLGLVAGVANILSLAAIYQLRRSMTSHMRIIVSLLASDLLIDASFIAHLSNTVVRPPLTPEYGTWEERLASRCSYMIIKALNTASLNITLLNLMAMAIDHYIAILRPFQLHKLMSRRRTIFMIVVLWIIAFISGFSDFLSPLGDIKLFEEQSKNLNLCEVIWLSLYNEEYTTFAIVVVCFFSMIFIYISIYCEVKGKDRMSTMVDSNVTHNKRALITTLFILGTFILCWLPICIFNVTLIIITNGGVNPETLSGIIPLLEVTDKYLYDLMLLNTLLDPIIYAIRMHEIRKGYWLMVRACLPRYSKLREMVEIKYIRPRADSFFTTTLPDDVINKGSTKTNSSSGRQNRSSRLNSSRGSRGSANETVESEYIPLNSNCNNERGAHDVNEI